MTGEEAIKILEESYPRCCKMVDGRYKGGFKDYGCELGQAITEAVRALEKQIQKKPEKTATDGYRHTDTYRCPTCGGSFAGTGIADYCYHCGQRLDWGMGEERGDGG